MSVPGVSPATQTFTTRPCQKTSVWSMDDDDSDDEDGVGDRSSDGCVEETAADAAADDADPT